MLCEGGGTIAGQLEEDGRLPGHLLHKGGCLRGHPFEGGGQLGVGIEVVGQDHATHSLSRVDARAASS